MKKSKMTQIDGKTNYALDQKNQYYQNGDTIQGNLQIQCIPYQITKDIFAAQEQNILKFVWKKKKSLFESTKDREQPKPF